MVSFIVPAYNEESLIADTLQALNAAGVALAEPFEIVVADDASTDRTAVVAREHGACVVSVSNRQIAATRNAGARAATGDLLIFVDADTIVTPAAVRAAVDAMRAGAVGGGAVLRFDGRIPFYGRMLVKTFMPLYRMFGIATGCFLFCTRQAFEAIGGFDERLFAAEELFMSRALGKQGRVVMLRECVTTSGRKLRAYSGREALAHLTRLLLSGEKGLRQRERMDLWYGERRSDPALEEPRK